MTTRVCHSQTVITPREKGWDPLPAHFEHDIRGRVMIPGFARPAHKRLRKKLAEIYEWGETMPLHKRFDGSKKLGIITAGVCYVHAREAAPDASFLKLGMTYPLPYNMIKEFAKTVDRLVVIEENDPYLVDAIRAEGVEAEGKAEMYRFDEINVDRVRRILAHDESPEPVRPPGKPPQLCLGCPHRSSLSVLKKLDCIIMGDIGCYTLGVLPPIDAMDSCLCMGASIGNGLGLRHVLPENEARKVVSVIGDSTFVHGGITGLVEMAYNPPPTGHVVLILDNGTTAMTGLQDHPGTGRRLNKKDTHKLSFEDLARSIGITNVHVFTGVDPAGFEALVKESLAKDELTLIIARRPCLLSVKKQKAQTAAAQQPGAATEKANA